MIQTRINFNVLPFAGCLFAVVLCGTGNCQTAAQAELIVTADAKKLGSTVGIGLEKCFERLRFQRPILLTHAGDGSDRIFVLEQGGRILVFENG